VGKISLPVSFGDLENARTESLTFDVVDIYHPYLAIFGRGFMNKFDAVIRQQFLCMKMPAPKGVITVFGNQQEARNIEKRPHARPNKCVPAESSGREEGNL
jgi:hypothetical protein